MGIHSQYVQSLLLAVIERLYQMQREVLGQLHARQSFTILFLRDPGNFQRAISVCK